MPDVVYYSIVRVVPNPTRGEAINIGVVVVSEGGDLADFRFSRYKARLSAVAPDFDPYLVGLFVRDFQGRFPRLGATQQLSAIASKLTPTKETLSQLAEQHASEIQFTRPRAYIADDKMSAIDELQSEFLAIKRPPRQIVDRSAIRTRVRRALSTWGMPHDRIVSGPSLQGRRGESFLDLGVLSPSMDDYTAVIEPISFAIPSRGDVARERDHLAWVALDVGEKNKTLAIWAVVTQPSPSNKPIFEQSLAIFEELHVHTVSADDMEALRSGLVV